MAQQEKTNNGKEQKRSLASILKSFDEVSFFKWENILANIPYFMFLVVIGIFYIWNNHRGVEMDRDIRELNTHLLEKQYYYNATSDSLTQQSRQSTVARMVDTLQMQELSHPPYTIKTDDGKH
jgi:hypothetical protein